LERFDHGAKVKNLTDSLVNPCKTINIAPMELAKDTWMTVKQYANREGVSVVTVHRWIAANKVESIRKGWIFLVKAQ